MEITLGHTYRWHATTEYISLACNYRNTYRWHATTEIHIASMQLPIATIDCKKCSRNVSLERMKCVLFLLN